ncbi:MAG TPA: hypothetical protein VG406_16890 [Isosphaeraceae bacterium]|nr:hypothetical protein [Isosphaeraceae bacterium]
MKPIRIRFGLRGMMGTVAFAAIGFSLWESLVLRPVAREQQSATQLKRLGADVFSTDNRPEWEKALLRGVPVTKVLRVDLEGTRVASADLVHLRDFPRLAALSLKKTEVDDSGIPFILEHREFRQLDLSHTKVTDFRLEALTELVDLDLRGTHIARLSLDGLSKLEGLNLGSTNIHEFGLRPVGGLSALRSLDLRDTKIRDADLDHLKTLTNLKVLYLYDTPVTDRGVAELRRAIPGLEVRRFGTTATGGIRPRYSSK